MSALNKLIEAVDAGDLQQPQCINKHEDDHDCSDDWLSHPLLDLVPAGVLHVHQMGELVLAYEGSLDAALALHEALLPGWRWDLDAACNAGVWNSCDLLPAITGEANTPARAWLLAVLKAYRSIQDDNR